MPAGSVLTPHSPRPTSARVVFFVRAERTSFAASVEVTRVASQVTVYHAALPSPSLNTASTVQADPC